jgi:hypothetical protein
MAVSFIGFAKAVAVPEPATVSLVDGAGPVACLV